LKILGDNTKRKYVILPGIVVFLLVVVGICFYMEYKETHITTDDAFVAGSIHLIASKIPGSVEAVRVHDNQFVRKGDILIELDERDYALKSQEAESVLNAENSRRVEILVKVDVAKKQLSEICFKIASAEAYLKLQQTNFKQVQMDLARAEKLFQKSILPEEKYEKAKTNYDVASAQVEAAKEQLRQAQAALDTQKAIVSQSEAAIQTQGSLVKQREEISKMENLRRSYTKVYAPSEGYITKKSVEVGNQIQAGQPLMAIVSLENVWIVANYKETQLEKVRAGQKVKIKVDTYSGKEFDGRVDSIMAGTGSIFSLFPPENATGNYVKIVQRIPVKIVLEKGADPDHLLRVGMSAISTIIIEK
jgi:membrane fusion protein (multidrug efflux system)